MAWYLYLLECADGSIYTGITINVKARYAAHAAGRGARYTRSHPPARLLASIEYPDRSSASKAEYAMKQLTAVEKREAGRRAAGEKKKSAKKGAKKKAAKKKRVKKQARRKSQA